MKQWLQASGVKTLYIEPGSPWENAYSETFISRLSDEVLKRELFADLLEAKVLIEDYRGHYNYRRPHSALGYLTPAEFALAADLERKVENVVWGVSGILAVAYKGVQAPDTFAFYLIIGIFIVALVLTVMGMVGFRTELQHRRNGRRIEGVAYYTVIAALVGQVLCALVLWAVGIPVARALGLYGMNVLFGLLWLALGGYVLFSKVRADPAPQ